MSESVDCDRRRYWNRLLLRAFALIAVVGIRGQVIAYFAEGSYPFGAFAFDATAVVVLFLALSHLESWLVTCLRRLIRSEAFAPRSLIHTVRLTFLCVVIVPFLVVTLTIHPQRIACRTPPDVMGLPFQDVRLSSDGIELRGWYVPARNSIGPVVLVAHGIGANKQNFLLAVADLHAMGFPVLTVDFRAHGNSEGQICTLGMNEAADVKAAYDWLAKTHPGRPVYAVAFSMGGAAVARATWQYGIFDKIVFDSTFADLHRVADYHYLRYFGPLRHIVWQEGCFWGKIWTGVDFSENKPESYAPALASKPILLIHGTADTVIPCSESIRFHQSLGNRSELWLIDGAKHIETMLDPNYASRLRQFFDARRDAVTRRSSTPAG